jgi:hypothetical protein
MQIQLRESRFGVGPGEMRESKAPNGREEELLKAQVWCGEDDLGEYGKEIGRTGRHKES